MMYSKISSLGATGRSVGRSSVPNDLTENKTIKREWSPGDDYFSDSFTCESFYIFIQVFLQDLHFSSEGVPGLYESSERFNILLSSK